MSRNKRAILGLVLGAILVVVAAVYYTLGGASVEPISWELTLVGEEETVISFDELTAMPSYEGRGGFFTTVGVVNGPYRARGVPLEDVCAFMGGVGPQDAVRVSAPDGYSMVFSRAQLNGDFVTYEPSTMKEVPHGELEVILMYQQDGGPLPQDCGHPLRVAIVGSEPLLTEGHYWVKWVNKVEVLRFE